jgi:hypothetical protein
VHHGREHLGLRQSAQRHVPRQLRPDRRQGARELQHAFVLGALAHFAELGVVLVLLAAARIAPGRLQVAVGTRADPHVGPGRRDRQLADALQRGFVVHRAAAVVEVLPAAVGVHAPQPRCSSLT